MKLVYSDKKTGKTAQVDVPKDRESLLASRKIGDVVEGAVVDLQGYKLQITGLSDSIGTPSRKEISGTAKARPLLGRGAGIRKAKHGHRERRLARGNTIGPDTMQVNTVIAEYGSKPVEELFKPKEEKKE